MATASHIIDYYLVLVHSTTNTHGYPRGFNEIKLFASEYPFRKDVRDYCRKHKLNVINIVTMYQYED